MSTQPFSGQIAAAGQAGGAVLQLPGSDTEAIVVISGTFAGLVLFFDASRDQVPQSVYFPVLAVRMSDLATQVSDPNGVPTADGATRAWRVLGLEGCTALRVWASGLASGTVAVQLASGSFFASSPVASAIGSGLTTTQVLFQLEQLKLALIWLKEPSGSHEPTLAGGDLLNYLSNPGQSAAG
jgi:hypothetical protein